MMFPGMPFMNDAMGAMGWWAFGSILTGVALVAIMAFVLMRDRGRTPGDSGDAKRILDARLAKGEIGVEEYRERLALLG